MNPNGSDNTLFRGIPRSQRRGPRTFITSLAIHVILIGLLAFATPAVLMQSGVSRRFETIWVAPPEAQPVPKPVKPRIPVEIASAPPRPLRELPRPAELRVPLPKLEEAPALKTAKPEIVLAPPVPAAPIRPPVQTGVFASNAPVQSDPKLPVPPAQTAGFDTAAAQIAATPQPSAATSAGFDSRAAEARPAATPARIQTGGFEQAAAGDSRSSRLLAANVGHTAFDVRGGEEKPTVPEQSVRKAGFDEQKAANAPARPAAAAVATVRPVEILDKPKPVYTPEARMQKIEGTVLLDVIFTASGEVRVLGVKSGLGHGLDENAVDAARHIRFTPAMQAGTPVDQHVLLHVVFQITG